MGKGRTALTSGKIPGALSALGYHDHLHKRRKNAGQIDFFIDF
jgi:hypothetical protein